LMIISVPESCVIPTMRDDVIHLGSWGDSSLALADGAEWMLDEVGLSVLSPCPGITPFSGGRTQVVSSAVPASTVLRTSPATVDQRGAPLDDAW
jgi:hypothetical protein